MLTVKRLVMSAIFAVALMVTASRAYASCANQTITMVLDFPAQCSGKGAFQTAGSGQEWICAASSLQMQIVTAAFLSGRSIDYQLGASDNDCNPDAQYVTSKAPQWLYMH